MLKQLVFFIHLFFALQASGQFYDKNWVMGVPNLVLVFNEDDIDIDSSLLLNRSTFFLFSSSTISSANHILFFTDGAKVYDRFGNLMQDGDKIYLSNKDMQTTFADTSKGHGILSNPVCIPFQQHNDSFLVLHRSQNDTVTSYDIYYSVIDMKENNGLGKVVNSSQSLACRMSGTNIAACKHANGKAWWLVARIVNSNSYIKWQLDEWGNLSVVDTQQVGIAYFNPDFLVQNVFSFQGNLFVTGGHYHTSIMHFDRCSGQLQFIDSIPTPYDSLFNGTTGIQLSPSGRYLYISSYNNLDQYDLSATDISASRVRLMDLRVHNAFRKIMYMQTTPNNKIFIAGYSSPIPLSIIHQPDSAGWACGLDTFVLPFNNSLNTTGMPTYPHYRTPAAEVWQAGAGSSRTVCDSVIAANGVTLGKPHIPGITYHWSSPNNTTFSSTQPQPVVYPTQTTTYILHLRDTVNTYYSCTERFDTLTITVTPDCYTGVSSTSEGQGAWVRLFPNPTADQLTIEAHTNGVFQLYNSIGQLVRTATLQKQTTHTLRLQPLAAGLYHYRFTATSGALQQGKVVKE